jgi:hypothetical protein
VASAAVSQRDARHHRCRPRLGGRVVADDHAPRGHVAALAQQIGAVTEVPPWRPPDQCEHRLEASSGRRRHGAVARATGFHRDERRPASRRRPEPIVMRTGMSSPGTGSADSSTAMPIALAHAEGRGCRSAVGTGARAGTRTTPRSDSPRCRWPPVVAAGTGAPSWRVSRCPPVPRRARRSLGAGLCRALGRDCSAAALMSRPSSRAAGREHRVNHRRGRGRSRPRPAGLERHAAQARERRTRPDRHDCPSLPPAAGAGVLPQQSPRARPGSPPYAGRHLETGAIHRWTTSQTTHPTSPSAR